MPPTAIAFLSLSGCLYNGVTRAEGDVFSLSSGNCTVCVCLVSVAPSGGTLDACSP